MLAGTGLTGNGGAYTVVNSVENQPGVAMTGWGAELPKKEILEWAVARQMVPVPDLPPVRDDRALFIGRYGSSVMFTGLDKEKKYILWIDFLKYNRNSLFRYDTMLTVEVRAPGSSAPAMKIELQPAMISGEKLYRLELPYRHTSWGAVEISFREQAFTGGIWALWDMILASDAELPESIEIRRPDMLIEEKPVR